MILKLETLLPQELTLTYYQKVQLSAEAAIDDIEWDEPSENEEAELI